MLDFFRRYQKGLFIVITIVIIISFSFFGTFQAVHGRDVEDKPAFTAVDGSKVLSSELNDMVLFLSQDSYDTMFSASPFAGNALNDGALAHDIIDTGLATVIVGSYLEEVGADQQVKLEREKRYKTYQHPRAPFISASQVWNYYAPDIAKNLAKMNAQENAKSMEAFKARVNLFSAERKFPPSYLKQFLRYQETMHKWLSPDANLANYDLALFGYHNAQDWFGRRFIELAAEFIINAARFAESKGYTVTKEEALGSLFRNCEAAYRDSALANSMSVKNPSDYFQEQLRHLSMDQGRVVKVWSQILLFRRLFFDNADSVLVSPIVYEDFYKHLNEYVDVDLYQLPQEFQLKNTQELEKCIMYHAALSQNGKNSSQFSSPNTVATLSDIKKNHPELVEKPYHVTWKEVNKEHLQAKVGVKPMWQWQVKDENWQVLKDRYPELSNEKQPEAAATGDVQEQRLRLLDAMEPARRAMVDSFSRQEIVNEHPEWLHKALQDEEAHDEVVFVRLSGGKVPFSGMSDRAALMQLFDTVQLQTQDPALASYSQDGVHYYAITIVDRQSPEAIISYEKAKSDGTLNEMHQKLASKDSFDGVFKELDQKVETFKNQYPTLTDWKDKTKARITAYFLPYVIQVKNVVRKEPEQESRFVNVKSEQPASVTLSADSYKLLKSREKLTRKDSQSVVNPAEAFSLAIDTQSDIASYPTIGLAFFNPVQKGYLAETMSVREKVLEERSLLGNDAICMLGDTLVKQMVQKKAVSESVQDVK